MTKLEPRLMELHQVNGFGMALFELPDLMVDRPYLVAVRIESSSYERAEPFATQTEARVFMEQMIEEHLPAQVAEAMSGMRKQLIIRKSSAMNDK